MPTFHIIVKGRVQGVFYRVNARKFARSSSLTGWVRNLPGGKVEIMVTGAADKIDEFVIWCRSGPEKAEVESVEVREIKEQYFNDFIIK